MNEMKVISWNEFKGFYVVSESYKHYGGHNFHYWGKSVEECNQYILSNRLLSEFTDEDKDDFALTIDNLFFRMEQLDKDSWWIQLYRGEQPLFLDGNVVDTREEAISILINKGAEILHKN